MEIEVHGMTCSGCESKVEAALSAIIGVSSVSADRDASRVTVDLHPANSSDQNQRILSEVTTSIEDMGYRVQAELENTDVNEHLRDPILPKNQATQTASEPEAIHSADRGVVLDITGMTCASCVRSVEQAIESLDEVSFATVNFANSTATVSTSGDIASVVQKVILAGYGATPSSASEVGDKQANLQHKLARETIKSLVALTVAVALMYNDALAFVPNSTQAWLGVAVIVIVILFVVGGRYYRSAWSSLKRASATMDTLIAMGTGAAWVFSTVTVLFPEFASAGTQQNFFEAALFVIGFVHLGKSIEEYAKGNTSLALYELLNLQPSLALRVVGNGLEDEAPELVPVDEIRVGDRLCIRAGESIALDGKVIKGESAVDEQMLTGESIPVIKCTGDSVTGGTLNTDGTLYIEVESVGENTVLSRMIEAVQQAQNSKPAIGHLADKVAAVFVPAVIAIAIASACIWWLLVPEFQHGFTVFMTVLIIACPCALGLAIPLSIVVGIGRAARLGIVVRNSDALQRANEIDTVVVDKTGTLTQGKPRVVSSVIASDVCKEQFASLALSLEANSMHPLASAVVQHYGQADKLSLDQERVFPGMGVTAEYQGKHCILGSQRFLASHNYPTDEVLAPEFGSHVYLGFDGVTLGVIVLEDSIRETSKSAVEQLQARKIDVCLLSGDRYEAVQQIACTLGITEAKGEMSPEMKQAFIADLQMRGAKVAMVGDGINDALALSQADVGFAMGTGSDVALESADITLMRNDLGALPQALVLSRKVMNNIYQNLFAAFAYNVALIPVAAGVLYPFTDTLLNPGLAGLAMALSSLSVVANAGRLRLMA